MAPCCPGSPTAEDRAQEDNRISLLGACRTSPGLGRMQAAYIHLHDVYTCQMQHFPQIDLTMRVLMRMGITGEGTAHNSKHPNC